MSTLEFPDANTILNGKRVLVCETEAVLSVHLTRMMQAAGAAVVWQAYDGNECLRLAAANRPDVVLIRADMRPVSGMEVARKILAIYSPCIVMIAEDATSALQAEAKSLDLCAVLRRPIKREEMQMMAAAYFARRHG